MHKIKIGLIVVLLLVEGSDEGIESNDALGGVIVDKNCNDTTPNSAVTFAGGGDEVVLVATVRFIGVVVGERGVDGTAVG